MTPAEQSTVPAIVQATWVRFHHFDLARELHARDALRRIFTSLPFWKARIEARHGNIPRDKISTNPVVQGLRHLGARVPGYGSGLDNLLSVLQTKQFSAWVARQVPECDAFIGISGTGLKAGGVVQRRGGVYIMDRGSTHIVSASRTLEEEYRRWDVRWDPIHPWLVANEVAETEAADMITVPSDFAKGTFVAEGVPAEKVRVVPYGISLGEFSPVGEPVPDGEFRLLFVGQFSLRNGAPYLLEAFRQFRHPRKSLTVVGSVQPELASLLADRGTEGIHFVGPVPRDQVRRYMSKAHALVLPSIEEGLALVQAQALACGCPVVATPNSGSENLFTTGREGLIVEARSASALVHAFEQLADDAELLRSMRTAALARAGELGGWKGYAQGVIDVVREALGTRKRALR